MAMDRVEFHRLAVLFSGGLNEREMQAAFPGAYRNEESARQLRQ